MPPSERKLGWVVYKETMMLYRLVFLCGLMCLRVLVAQPPVFSSGSTGADGALTFPAGAGLVYFNPANFAARTNNIYNFTTINIPAGTTVRLSGWIINGPVFWLAQGDVTIAGTLDLTGQPGHPCCGSILRAPSEPGAGGYSGGLGRSLVSGQLATPGNGPGGGAAPNTTANTNLYAGGVGSYASSLYLIPLVGGSGGSGGCSPANGCAGGGGGAGGGAILIASTTQITINSGGSITAKGGDNDSGHNYGGSGSGGAIRLVSNKITNSGGISVSGGSSPNALTGVGGTGLARLEAFTLTPGSVAGSLITSLPYGLALPIGGSPNLTVASVNGVTINANPFTFPDTSITTSSAVPVVISGTFIPNNTTGTLYIFSETGSDQAIPFTLTGSFASTTATVNVTYPAGGSRGFAKATWVTP